MYTVSNIAKLPFLVTKENVNSFTVLIYLKEILKYIRDVKGLNLEDLMLVTDDHNGLIINHVVLELTQTYKITLVILPPGGTQLMAAE